MEGQQREERKKESIKWVGKLIIEARKVMKQAAKTSRDAKCRPYHLHPQSKALHEIRRYQKTTELLIKKLSFQKSVREIAQKITPNFRFQANALRASQEATKSYIVGLMGTQIYVLYTQSTLQLCPKICS